LKKIFLILFYLKLINYTFSIKDSGTADAGKNEGNLEDPTIRLETRPLNI
jgi:hypothetical protein